MQFNKYTHTHTHTHAHNMCNYINTPPPPPPHPHTHLSFAPLRVLHLSVVRHRYKCLVARASAFLSKRAVQCFRQPLRRFPLKRRKFWERDRGEVAGIKMGYNTRELEACLSRGTRLNAQGGGGGPLHYCIHSKSSHNALSRGGLVVLDLSPAHDPNALDFTEV